MQGCHLKCKYCQNRDTWDVSSPDSIECTTDEVLNKILKYKIAICYPKIFNNFRMAPDVHWHCSRGTGHPCRRHDDAQERQRVEEPKAQCPFLQNPSAR